MNISTWRS